MQNQLIEIKIPKAIVFLTVREIIENLPAKVLETGLKRGKAILRYRRLKKRAEQDDSWQQLNPRG